MNYDEQQKYLRGSRVWGAVVCAGFLVLAAASLRAAWDFGLACGCGRWDWIQDRWTLVSAPGALAVAVSIFYSPDYLHLTVTPNKPQAWQIRIRWRIAAAIAILSLVGATSAEGRLAGVGAGVVVATVNLIGKRFRRSAWLSLGYAFCDFAVLIVFAIFLGMDPAVFIVLATLIVHLWVVSDLFALFPLVTTAVGTVLLAAVAVKTGDASALLLWAALAVSTIGTSCLVHRAKRQHAKNRDAALRELMDYTHRSSADVERMWQTSNQQLAANWEKAKLAPDDRAALAKWYADNSELYLFAISAYNLEYRRIKSNLFVLRYGHGHALDYGAGNGELVLEMARRGQRAAYYDVDGATLRFARWRAQQRGLEVEFFTDKPPLAALARERPFDTVFSFDVLEHIPDLAAELDFLSSLLAPGGQMVFDLPTGATKAHPMHLEHHLDFRKHLEAKGLRERKRWADYLPFRKQEKFVFVK